jgi:N-acetylmuramoyl-L-alanine amidase
MPFSLPLPSLLRFQRPLLLLPALLFLSACGGLAIDTSHTAVGQDSRVQFVVLHYTSSDFSKSLRTLTRGEVSSHYLIAQQPPKIYRLVDEDRRAWHAGDSQWRGRTWLNSSSIGIELVNPGYRDTPQGRIWYPYAQEQIELLVALLGDIARRHQLAPINIVGHSDIAPQRKVDPGPLFPWLRLAEAGLIVWPDAAQVAARQTEFSAELPDALWFQQQLAEVGYPIAFTAEFDEQTRNVLAAMQMKYRPARHDGTADAESAAILSVLVAKLAQ